MTEEEIESLIKKLILENMTVEVSVTTEPYSNNEYFNIDVIIEYDGEAISSYGDTIRIPDNT